MKVLTVGTMVESLDTDLRVRVAAINPEVVGCIYLTCGIWENKPGFHVGAHYSINVATDPQAFWFFVGKEKIELRFPEPMKEPDVRKPKKGKNVTRTQAA